MQLGHVPCTCGVMIRRRALELTGGFDEAFPLYEDQTLWVKLMLRFPIYVTLSLEPATDSMRTRSAPILNEAGVYVRTRPHQARIAFLTGYGTMREPPVWRTSRWIELYDWHWLPMGTIGRCSLR